MKCTAGPNDYHMPTRPKFVITMRDCQLRVSNVITGSLPYETIEDIKTIDGEQAAKDAWWELYLWIREQERIQDEK
jgi:hypothetical protein